MTFEIVYFTRGNQDLYSIERHDGNLRLIKYSDGFQELKDLFNEFIGKTFKFHIPLQGLECPSMKVANEHIKTVEIADASMKQMFYMQLLSDYFTAYQDHSLEDYLRRHQNGLKHKEITHRYIVDQLTYNPVLIGFSLDELVAYQDVQFINRIRMMTPEEMSKEFSNTNGNENNNYSILAQPNIILTDYRHVIYAVVKKRPKKQSSYSAMKRVLKKELDLSFNFIHHNFNIPTFPIGIVYHENKNPEDKRGFTVRFKEFELTEGSKRLEFAREYSEYVPPMPH